MRRFGTLTALLLAFKETKCTRQNFETKFLFSLTNLIISFILLSLSKIIECAKRTASKLKASTK